MTNDYGYRLTENEETAVAICIAGLFFIAIILLAIL